MTPFKDVKYCWSLSSTKIPVNGEANPYIELNQSSLEFFISPYHYPSLHHYSKALQSYASRPQLRSFQVERIVMSDPPLGPHSHYHYRLPDPPLLLVLALVHFVNLFTTPIMSVISASPRSPHTSSMMLAGHKKSPASDFEI